jgi:hypothetical protein
MSVPGVLVEYARFESEASIDDDTVVGRLVPVRWKYQHDSSDTLHTGAPVDSRGLKIRRDCGYTHVHMGTADGWLQISVAIRKVEMIERLDALMAVTS